MSDAWHKDLVTQDLDRRIQAAKLKEESLKQTLRAFNQLQQMLKEHPEIDFPVYLTRALINDSSVVSRISSFFLLFNSKVYSVSLPGTIGAIILELKKQTAIAIAERYQLEKAR